MTRRVRFQGMLMLGHKEAAVETPFDPEARWRIPARRLWHGRRGHAVKGTLNGAAFESYIVPRMGRFFLLVDDVLQDRSAANVGETVQVVVEPAVVPR